MSETRSCPLGRREFLRLSATGAAAAALTASPFTILRAGARREGSPAVVGEGEYRYECHHNWGEVPAHIQWYETHGVAVDKEGMIYITHRGGGAKASSPEMAQDTVVVFDADGKFVRSFGKAYHGGGHGIDIREEGGQEYLYLSCMFPVNLVVKTDLKGEVVWVKEKPEEPGVYKDPNARFSPTNVAFAPEGGFYVADGYGSNYIHQYDSKGNWVRTFGGTGEGLGQFKTPHGIWLDDRIGRTVELVVADRANARLQYLSTEGQPKSINTDVSFPAHFDIRGEILLVPDLHARVTLMGKENRVLTHLGYNADWTKEVLDGFKVRQDPSRWPAGRFIHPHDACFDAEGNIFVAEWVATGRISKLRRLG